MIKDETRTKVAVAFQAYCQALAKVLEECKDTMLAVELERLSVTAKRIETVGLGVSDLPTGAGNFTYLKLEAGTPLSKGVLANGYIHDDVSSKFWDTVADELNKAADRLNTVFYIPEPTLFVLKPYTEDPSQRHITAAWAEWFTKRNPESDDSLVTIGKIGGIRIHEWMVKEGHPVIGLGETLKVSVDITGYNRSWKGEDIPVRLYKISTTEF